MFSKLPFVYRNHATQTNSTLWAVLDCVSAGQSSRRWGFDQNKTDFSQSRGSYDYLSLTGNFAGCVSEVNCSPVGKAATSMRPAVSPLLGHVNFSVQLVNQFAHALLVLSLIILLVILLPTGAGG